MAEGLRGVSELPAGPRIPFLAEQAHVIAQREQALEEFDGLVATTDAQ